MFLNSKKISFLGLLLALTILLVFLSGVIETNSLFLLIAASYGTGIAFREMGLRLGGGFYIASVILSLLIVPNKLYCLTYAALAFYIVIYEIIFEKLTYTKLKHKNIMFWGIKYIVFNCMYIPVLVLAPKVVFSGDINSTILLVLIALGQIGVLILDKIYCYFQKFIWGKFRAKINSNI